MPGLVLPTYQQHPRPTIQPQPRQQQQSGAHARSQTIDALPTNTLILTSLPAAFFHPSILEPLRDHFMNYGELHTWAPLKGFGRIIAVFWSVEDAERLRQECDGLHVGGPESSFKTLRLYRGDMTSLETPPPESKHLQVPAHTKNFLISPPGSPPVGWEPVEEEPPNAAALAADLMAALTRLQHQQAENESAQHHGKKVQVLLDTAKDQDVAREREQQRRERPGRTDSASSESLLVLLEDVDASSKKGKRGCGSGSGRDTPDEIIEILNPAHEMSSSRGWSPPHRQQRLPQTAMPPPGFGSITSVRATVESMRTVMPPSPP